MARFCAYGIVCVVGSGREGAPGSLSFHGIPSSHANPGSRRTRSLNQRISPAAAQHARVDTPALWLEKA